MRRSDERRQWEHTDETEALFGFQRTSYDDMPPSLATMLRGLRDQLATITAGRDALREALGTAERLLRLAVDGGMTDYTEAPNEPVCGFCGYEVTTCNAKLWDDDGQPYTEDNPCPGIEARAFLALAALSPRPPEPALPGTGGRP